MNSGAHEAQSTGEQIECQIRFSKRRQLNICVHADLSVVVDAPKSMGVEEVMAQVRKHARWIARRRRFYEQAVPSTSAKRYVDGEGFHYLGKEHILKVLRSEKARVKLDGDFIKVYVPHTDDGKRVKRLVEGWFRYEAGATFERRLDACMKTAERHGLPRPEVRLRRMKGCWGTSHGAKGIVLNTELVRTPVESIDFVIMHEICHHDIRNHGKGFYELLAKCMPDWKERKKLLARFVL